LVRHQPPEVVAELRRLVLEGNGTIEPTAAKISALLGDAPRRAVRDRLHTGALKLGKVLGENARLDVLFDELQRLEASYG
jgi:hypothetical protein